MVAAAARLLRRQGYAATGWRLVVAESGAPWGSQAHFFPGGKQQLASEALALEAERVRADIATALAMAHPAEMIIGWAEFAAAQLEGTDWADGCPIATTALEMAHASAPLASVCHAAFLSWQAEFHTGLTERGIPGGEAQALAMLVVAATEGALLLAAAARDAAPLHLVAGQLADLLRTQVP